VVTKYTDRESFSEINTRSISKESHRTRRSEISRRIHITVFKILPETLNQDVWHRWFDRRDWEPLSPCGKDDISAAGQQCVSGIVLEPPGRAT